MRILFGTYSLAFQNPGGGEQVIHALRKELTQLGATVDLFNPWRDDPARYDIIHYFSCLETSFWPFVKENYATIPLVVTPTLWQGAGVKSWLGLAKQLSLGRLPESRLARYRLPDHWLPTTSTELERLAVFWRVDRARLSVLPNGVEDFFAHGDPGLFRERWNIREPFVLHVGRFHPVKNQLLLIEALSQAGLRGVFIGNPDLGHGGYYEKCREKGRAHCQFLPAIAHDDPMLASAYSAAAVFALPSQFETFGIAALEAAVAGAPLVLSANVWSRGLFEGSARFVAPGSVHALANALTEASTQRANFCASGAPQRLLAEYEWRNIARQLLNVYERLITK